MLIQLSLHHSVRPNPSHRNVEIVQHGESSLAQSFLTVHIQKHHLQRGSQCVQMIKVKIKTIVISKVKISLFMMIDYKHNVADHYCVFVSCTWKNHHVEKKN